MAQVRTALWGGVLVLCVLLLHCNCMEENKATFSDAVIKYIRGVMELKVDENPKFKADRAIGLPLTAFGKTVKARIGTERAGGRALLYMSPDDQPLLRTDRDSVLLDTFAESEGLKSPYCFLFVLPGSDFAGQPAELAVVNPSKNREKCILTGTEIVKLFLGLTKALRYKSATLNDGSSLSCQGLDGAKQAFSLADTRAIAVGQTWYMTFGFTPFDDEGGEMAQGILGAFRESSPLEHLDNMMAAIKKSPHAAAVGLETLLSALAEKATAAQSMATFVQSLVDAQKGGSALDCSLLLALDKYFEGKVPSALKYLETNPQTTNF